MEAKSTVVRKAFLPAILLVTVCGALSATGLQPIGTSSSVGVTEVRFDATVRNEYASVVMEVCFAAAAGNANSANLRFPLPPGTVIHGAEIYLPLQERWEAAETVGRQQGENVYNDIVNPPPPVDAYPNDPLLIQEIDDDFYRARVYPITASNGAKIRIRYAHLLERDNPRRTLRIAFAHPDSFPATPTGGITVSVVLEPNAWGNGNWKSDNAPNWRTSFDGVAGHASLYHFENYTMDEDILLDLTPCGAIGHAGALLYRSENPAVHDQIHAWWDPDCSAWPAAAGGPRNVVFVIDRSGSMSWSKMEQAKAAVSACMESLAATDTFGVMAFDREIIAYSPRVTAGNDRSGALAWVSFLQARGDTAMEAALVRAAEIGSTCADPNANVDLFLITDGRPNVGGETASAILDAVGAVEDPLGRAVRIFCCGIGWNLDQALLKELASRTGGETTFALADAEITRRVTGLFDRMRAGGISGVSAQPIFAGFVEGGPFTYRRLFPGCTIEMGGSGSPSESVDLVLSGTLPGGEGVTLSAVPHGPMGGSHEFDRIAAPLGAKARADQLERVIDSDGETAERVDAAVRLAKWYGIVTRYSSLLALESPELYVEHGIERISRDPSGVALSPVSGSAVDESRAGGGGTWDESPPAPGWDGPTVAENSDKMYGMARDCGWYGYYDSYGMTTEGPLRMYPNRASLRSDGPVRVVLLGAPDETLVRVYDASGRLVYTTEARSERQVYDRSWIDDGVENAPFVYETPASADLDARALGVGVFLVTAQWGGESFIVRLVVTP